MISLGSRFNFQEKQTQKKIQILLQSYYDLIMILLRSFLISWRAIPFPGKTKKTKSDFITILLWSHYDPIEILLWSHYRIAIPFPGKTKKKIRFDYNLIMISLRSRFHFQETQKKEHSDFITIFLWSYYDLIEMLLWSH